METPENNIVNEFENLNVLSTYDFQKMDELVQDLTNALEETSQKSSGGGGGAMRSSLQRYHRRRRQRKRRSYPSLLLDQGHFSEASESSLDEALKDYMENVFQQSDSDELLQRHLPALAIGHALSLAESDSVTENFSPMRTHRRRRRGKRMVVDSQLERDLPQPAPMCHPRGKHYHLRTLEVKNENVMHLDSRIADPSCADGHSDFVVAGKRKRSTGQEGEGSSGSSVLCSPMAGPSHLVAGSSTSPYPTYTLRSHCQLPGQPFVKGACSQQTMDTPCGSKAQESSSSLSSSESDCGIFTNDEARDGDDEQSDFFHEAGPACGVPGIIPWWETEKVMEEEDEKDHNLEDLLSGTLDIMSPTSRRTFKARISKFLSRNREIRMGRRRLKDRRGGYPLSRYKQESSRYENPVFSAWPSGVSPSSLPGDIKRRRKMPPPPNVTESAGYFRASAAQPIPECSLSSGLSARSWPRDVMKAASPHRMLSPRAPYLRPKRKGSQSQS